MKIKDLIRFPGRVNLPQIDKIRVDEPEKGEDSKILPSHLVAFDLVKNPGWRFFEDHQTVHIRMYYRQRPSREAFENTLKRHGFPLGDRLKLLKITVIN